jgi:hypothetical protein
VLLDVSLDDDFWSAAGDADTDGASEADDPEADDPDSFRTGAGLSGSSVEPGAAVWFQLTTEPSL